MDDTGREDDVPSGLGEAIDALSKGLESATHTLIAQEAMGWIVRGDLHRARRALKRLPVEQLAAVSVAAAALTSLADELQRET